MPSPRSRWTAALAVPMLAALLSACEPPPPPGPDWCRRTDIAADGSSAGAPDLGTTAYPMPAGTKVVSPLGSDSSDGTVAAPWQTLRKAVSASPSGATIVMRAGTYREQVQIPPTKRLTIQSYPGEIVWMKGSQVVDGWVADGGRWRHDGWTATFTHTGLDPNMIDANRPLAGYPDMAFVDQRALDQVATPAAVVPGTFAVDEAADQLWIGTDPTGRTIEASVLSEALFVESPGSIIRGIGFRHFATHMSRLGAVKMNGAGSVVEDAVFVDNAAAGLSVLAPDVVVRHSLFAGNGQLGIHGDRADRVLIEGNTVAFNNTEGFRADAAAGGIKLTESTDAVVRGNVAEHNRGHAIWFDLGSHRATVVGNVTRHTGPAAGIMFEMSTTALIAGNVSTNNAIGILAGESNDVELWNNVMIDNEVGFKAYKGYRTDRTVGFLLRNNVVVAPTSSGQPLLDNDDVTGTMNWMEMGWSSDRNAFYRRSSVTTPYFEVVANRSGRLHYKSRSAAAAAIGQEVNSLSTDNVTTNPYVVDASRCDYGMPAGSPARGQGAPLPADVAAALGVAPGVPVDIGVL